MTSIWLACVLVAWPASTGTFVGYHTEINGEVGPDVTAAEHLVCVVDKYIESMFRVQAFAADGKTGEWSDPLPLVRVHNFDANENGVSDVLDFGRFVGDFGTCYGETGIAEKC